MSNKNKRSKVMRGVSPKLILYHFTPPHNLLSILQHGIEPYMKDRNAHMLPGLKAVWLTANPEGNTVTKAHLDYWLKRGDVDDLLAEYAAGRHLLFGVGDNGYGSARITVELREPHVFHYMNLMRANYAAEAPAALARIAELPDVEDWWVSPKIIPPRRITEIEPVGDNTAHYDKIVQQIAEACGGELCEA